MSGGLPLSAQLQFVPMVPFRVTVFGAPRTKKNSQRIHTIRAKDKRTGQMREFHKVNPSAAYMEWAEAATLQASKIRGVLASEGVVLPVRVLIAVKATFYREANCGDLLGYEQGLADWMQETAMSKNGRKVLRHGAGFIVNDSQIKSWDGSRLAKDAAHPRVEFEVTEFLD